MKGSDQLTDMKKQIAERITDIDHMLEDLVMSETENSETVSSPTGVDELDAVEILHNILH